MDGRDGASRNAQGEALSPGLTNFTKELSGWPIRSTTPFVSTLITSTSPWSLHSPIPYVVAEHSVSFGMFVVGIKGFAVLCQPLLALFRLQGIDQSLL
jgi:hypothetical protein